MSQPSIEGVKTGLRLEKCTLCNHPPLGACNGEMVSSLFLLLYLYRQAKERERKKQVQFQVNSPSGRYAKCRNPSGTCQDLTIFFSTKKAKKKMQSRKEHANLWGIRCNYPMTFSIFRPLGLNPGVEQVMDFDIKRIKFCEKK